MIKMMHGVDRKFNWVSLSSQQNALNFFETKPLILQLTVEIVL
jgi:hypothetical protein